MKKLLLITTGGTIASGHSHSAGLSPEKNGGDMLPKLEDVSFDVLDLYAIDSTDVTPGHWRTLYNAVTENLPKYDGIVILHGTDTMAYTGAVLAFTVKTDKPVILTGSMLPFGAPDSDAQDNILFACGSAASGKKRGVWLAFHGRLIGGADIAKVDSTSKDAFRSYAGFEITHTMHFPDSGDKIPAVIKMTPFTGASDILRAAEGHFGMVIETYGAGGLPAGEITDAVRGHAKKMRVIITTPCLGGTDAERYEVGRRALAAGAVSGGKMSTECAAVCLWLTENNG